MKRDNLNLTAADWALLEELAQMPDEEIDTDDIPEVLEVRNPRRASHSLQREDTVTVNLDQDILHWWASASLSGDRAQLERRINDIVRTHIAQERSEQKS